MKGFITYLCLQSTQEGQAGHAHVNEIINGLHQLNWKIDLLEPNYKSATFPGVLTRLTEFLRIHLLFIYSDLRFPSKIQLLYVRHHFAAFGVALWAKIRRIPTIQEVNGTYEELFISWSWTRHIAFIFNWLQRIQLIWADTIITVTPALREWVFQETKAQHIYVIPNGANTKIFTPLATTEEKLPSPYVIFFGAMSKWQGVDSLLEAVKSSFWPKTVALVFVGDGVERVKVETEAKSNNRIIYLGRRSYKDIPGIVSKSLAGLSSKSSLGNHGNYCSPLKVYEALACGIPVIVTNFPGQADLVFRYQCGIVVPPDNPDEIAKAVSYISNYPEEAKAMGARGLKAVQTEHSWSKRAEDTEIAIIDTLMKLDNR